VISELREALGDVARDVGGVERRQPRPSTAAAKVLDEESYERIAARFAVSESVIRQRVSRGLRRLRTIVKETL